MKILIFCAVLFIQAAFGVAQEVPPQPKLLELVGDLRVHDPVMIRQNDTYYVFSTGGGTREGGFIPIRCSTDLIEWKQASSKEFVG